MKHLKYQPLLLLLFIACLFSCKNNKTVHTNNESKKWVSLFNGENLEGWEVKCIKEDKHYDFWKVKEGAIIVNSFGFKDHDYMWLSTKKEYGDFELKLKFQSYKESSGNSGVQIRSRYNENDKQEKTSHLGWLNGPQVDIDPSDPWRIGLIYDETRGHQRWIHPDLPDWNIDKEIYGTKTVKHYYADEYPYWNDLEIMCKGNQITTKLNGVKVSDYDGTGVLDDHWYQKFDITKTGYIALQLHKKEELKIAFKDIQIKEL